MGWRSALAVPGGQQYPELIVQPYKPDATAGAAQCHCHLVPPHARIPAGGNVTWAHRPAKHVWPCPSARFIRYEACQLVRATGGLGNTLPGNQHGFCPVPVFDRYSPSYWMLLLSSSKLGGLGGAEQVSRLNVQLPPAQKPTCNQSQ